MLRKHPLLFLMLLIFSCSALIVNTAVADESTSSDTDSGSTEIHIVKFVGKSLAAEMGPTLRENRTHRRNAGGRLVLDARASDSVRFLNSLQQTQNSRVASIGQELGRNLDVIKRYDVVLNGVAVHLTAEEAERVAALPYVEFVQRERIDQLLTYAGPPWIGADAIWDGSATVSGVGNRGEGMIAGVIDSGINTQSHPSFASTDGDGYVFTNPLGDGVYLGDCIGGTSGTNLVECNAKLIGAYGFVGGTPEDTLSDVGHGSHTASTMAGNVVKGPFVTTDHGNPPAIFTVNADEIAGVAPRANIIAYRGCDGGCPTSATSGSLQQALLDGVNATNYSIGPTVGGRGSNPWFDSSNRIMLDLVAAGIFVAASAGNTRGTTNPNPEADVANKGPWIATVANSTHGGVVAHDASLSDGGGPGAGLESIIAVQGTGPAFDSDISAPVILAADEDASNFEGCTAWAGSPFTDAVLLVSRGSCNFSVKVDNAVAAGAIGVIIHNNQPTPPFRMAGLGATTIPAVMISQDVGNDAVSFVSGNAGAIANIPSQVNVEFVQEWGNVLSGGSLKGPNLDFDISEPDINAPGTGIVAANATGDVAGFGLLSGTSMSGPHIAGSGLLLLSEHPDWTPTEVLSAMMLTADPVGTLGDGTATGPDDVGSGTLDLTKASLSGLVMDETFDNFLAANPATGGDPRTLNLPSMRHTACDPTCSWTRTVRSTSQADETAWTVAANSSPDFDVNVTPTSFELIPGDIIFRDQLEAGVSVNTSYQTIEITVTNNTSGSQMSFGEVILTEDGEQAPDARMTIAVSQSVPAAPAL